MSNRAIAIVGVGAVLPDAQNPREFWQNVTAKRVSIREVPKGRWQPVHYYNPDHSAPDKTYSKIGGFVTGFSFDWKKFRIPPKVADMMDEVQQWALAASAQALEDYGYPAKTLDTDRVGVVLGTAMGGDLHLDTHARVVLPEMLEALSNTPDFKEISEKKRAAIVAGVTSQIAARYPEITEDTMPGELSNIVSGRIANVLNLRGPNFITDAACASSLAAISTAVRLLQDKQCDAILTGGADRNMSVSSFVKFSKIGALSATGSRPFGDGADGFVMAEGCAIFLMKRLEDAERDHDKIYAVLSGVGSSSDGRGKGITAPNPVGQELAIRRAWDDAGLAPETVTLIEAHGTSTKVGDAVEFETLAKVFGKAARQSIALGSAKGNIGHLKAAAGAAGLLKAVLAIHEKTLPPTANAEPQNPALDVAASPFFLSHTPRAWMTPANTPRRAGVSSYGFGGTNFHLVIEEHVPGGRYGRPDPDGRGTKMPTHDDRRVPPSSAASLLGATPPTAARLRGSSSSPLAEAAVRLRTQGEPSPPCGPSRPPTSPMPLHGVFALGAATPADLKAELEAALARVKEGEIPARQIPDAQVLLANERLIVDFGDGDELGKKLSQATKAMAADSRELWTALTTQGIFRGRGKTQGKVAFLFPGQGSQYANMGRPLAELSPIVRRVFDDADLVMQPILGKKLTDYIFVDATDEAAMKAAERALTDTAITQPAVLTLDTAIYELLRSFGFGPDLVMGHSLGEYGALIAAGVMPFAHALEATAARGREMTKVSVADNGRMAAVFAPLAEIEAILREIDGYVVIANLNGPSQCVIGGASAAVDKALVMLTARGYRAQLLNVSHAFHTKIVAPASKPLREVLNRLTVQAPVLPVIGNVYARPYPTEPDAIRDLLELQIASPVRWLDGLEALYAAGVRTFVEVGPKKALKGLVDDVFATKPDVVSLNTNHPKVGDIASFNQALCGLWAHGFGAPRAAEPVSVTTTQLNTQATSSEMSMSPSTPMNATDTSVQALAGLLAQALRGQAAAPATTTAIGDSVTGSVVVTGTGLGLPGAEKALMDPNNVIRLLQGEQLIDLIPERFRKAITDRRVTRLVKAEDGTGSFETLGAGDVLKLAGRPGSFNLTEEYGVPVKLVETLDTTAQMAMAAGLDALREAGIPLARTYRKASNGKLLPDRLILPEPLRDETGVIFASAFPGHDRLIAELESYFTWQNRQDQLRLLESLRATTTDSAMLAELSGRAVELRIALENEPYTFDRRFLFRILAMGHSQFAEYIGARGPNTSVNSACASTTQAIAIAEDWIRTGRARRVIVIAADATTGDRMLAWHGAGFQALGAAATDDRVEDAATPFDRRRHGMIIGMGAVALVLESEDAVRERGMRGIVELLATETRNSAFHGSRLDTDHIAGVMESLVTTAERRFGLNRNAIAPELVFVSHETYTPARGGSAAAEVLALRRTFGDLASSVVIANTKGTTGHSMAVGLEDVAGVKMLEHGIVPPIPNYKEPDPDLGQLNLSRGGRYPIQYALRLAAGFGSQISMSLSRKVPGGPDRVDDRARYNRWLADVSGMDLATTEVVQRVLRIQDTGAPNRYPVAGTWKAGMGPSIRATWAQTVAASHGVTVPVMVRPMPIVQPTALAKPTAQQTPLTTSTPLFVDRSGPRGGFPERALPPLRSSAVDDVQPLPSHMSVAADDIKDRVLAIVASKTGYPVDMLDLELHLEADLGVDTVKQAETFAEIRATFDIPKQENVSLRDYATIGKVVQFVRDNMVKLGRAPTATVTSGGHPAADDGVQPAQVVGGDDIVRRVLEIVSAKTGYPIDMLDLELSLEADLGVDTVKQAETFAELRTTFNIPKQENLNLRDYATIGKIVQFVREQLPKTATETATPATPTPAPEKRTADDATQRTKRRVPVAVVRPQLNVMQPTGVTLNDGDRVIVAADKGGVAEALVATLKARGVKALRLDPSRDLGTVTQDLAKLVKKGDVKGLYWLPALDQDPTLAELDLERFHAETNTRVKALHRVMQALYGIVDKPESFLIVGTRMGGLHGYSDDGAANPMGGAVVGFAKAYKREKPAALVKAVDFEVDATAKSIATALVNETLRDPGAVELGLAAGLRHSVSFVETAMPAAVGPALAEGSVALVTGAAGGITSAIIADLATAKGVTFYLLDLAPEPARDNELVATFRRDREACKREIIDRLKARGDKPKPQEVDRQLMLVEREAAAITAIEAIEANGGKAHYRSIDLRDAKAVAAVVDEIRKQHGRLDLLVHAAGLEISRTLPEKDGRQFDLVFDVKADGWLNLLKAASDLPIGATVAFSSVAGRFGNAGQTDYSAANDLLCKWTSHLKRVRPDTKALVIDWTAWAGIGMATRGSIPTIMARAGIDMLPPEDGVPFIRRELSAQSRGELIVGGELGILTTEWAEMGGVAVGAALPDTWANAPRVTAAPLYGPIELEVTLDPKTQPFLFDHQVEKGLAYLPGVMGMELFALAAQSLAPGFRVAAVDNVGFLVPFKFYRGEPRTLFLSAQIRRGPGLGLVAELTLRSVIPAPKPDATAKTTVHFTGSVRLTTKAETAPSTKLVVPADAALVSRDDIYRVYFHGPAYQVLEKVQLAGNQAWGLLPQTLPADADPKDAAWLTMPRLVELCFQTVGIWEMTNKRWLALPMALTRLDVHGTPTLGARVWTQISAIDGGASFEARVQEETGRALLTLQGYRTVALASDKSNWLADKQAAKRTPEASA
jgi:malonyl CoA-acyl carrier protein transacylase